MKKTRVVPPNGEGAIVAYHVGNDIVCGSCLEDNDQITSFIEESMRDDIEDPINCDRCGAECKVMGYS